MRKLNANMITYVKGGMILDGSKNCIRGNDHGSYIDANGAFGCLTPPH